ncbi:hypothetical protein A2U01_0054148, partial [Trifolium medium]|nr:hypothetical protein [Trifolium medium]
MPSSPSRITSAPLPLRLDDPSTDSVHGCKLISSGGDDSSSMKSAKICDLMLPLGTKVMSYSDSSTAHATILLSQSSGGDYHCKGKLLYFLVTDLRSLEYPTDEVYWLLF